MKTILLSCKRQMLTWLKADAIRETIGDAVLGALCGFMYGMVLGGIGAQHHQDHVTILSFAGTAALGGCVIGTAVGVLRQVVKND